MVMTQADAQLLILHLIALRKNPELGYLSGECDLDEGYVWTTRVHPGDTYSIGHTRYKNLMYVGSYDSISRWIAESTESLEAYESRQRPATYGTW